MKKCLLPLVGLALFSIVFTACSNNAPGKTTTDTTASPKDATVKAIAVIYTCKMHPEVISDKPGICPKCGMDLVEKEDLAKDSTIQSTKMDSTKK